MSSQPIALSPFGQRMENMNKAVIAGAKGESPLAQFEKNIAQAKQESIAYFDKNGNKVYETKPGGPYSSRIPVEDLKKLNGVAVVSSHNHALADPAHPGSQLNAISASPDKYDMSIAHAHGFQEVRTVNANGSVSVKFH